MNKYVGQIMVALVLTLQMTGRLHAQGTAFTYQGQLTDGGGPANGSYDIRTTVYNALTNGSQTSGYVTNFAVGVGNGRFVITPDFGTNIFTGNAAWLELAVRTNGAVSFTTLAPRQALTPVPYAIMAGSASNLVGTVSSSQLPATVLSNGATGVTLNGTFGGVFTGSLQNFTNQLPTTLANINNQVATPINLGGGTNLSFPTTLANINNQIATPINLGGATNFPFPATLANVNGQLATPLNLAGGTNISASAITSGTWVNASINYAYKSFYTNYTITTNDVVLNCTGTNQLITLLPAANFPASTLLTIWSDNVNGSVTVTNGTGLEAITVPGVGRGLAIQLGSANSPSNSVTLMVHGGHW